MQQLIDVLIRRLYLREGCRRWSLAYGDGLHHQGRWRIAGKLHGLFWALTMNDGCEIKDSQGGRWRLGPKERL